MTELQTLASLETSKPTNTAHIRADNHSFIHPLHFCSSDFPKQKSLEQMLIIAHITAPTYTALKGWSYQKFDGPALACYSCRNVIEHSVFGVGVHANSPF